MLYGLFTLTISASKGYHTFTVKPDRPFSVSLSRNMLVLTLVDIPPESLNFTVSDRSNCTHPVPIGQHSHIAFYKTSIFASISKGSFMLHFWLIPTNLCGSVSYSAVADYQVIFEIRSNLLPSDFCIFSQSGASSHKVDLHYQSDGTNNSAAFYTNGERSAKSCGPGSLCRFSSSRPFFVRFSNVYEAGFDAKLSVVVNRHSIETADCGFRPIPVLIEPPMQMPLGGLLVLDLHCSSMAVAVLRVILAGGLAFICAVALLVVLHRTGCIDMRPLCGCTNEQHHFDSLRDNPYAGQLDQGVGIEDNI
jgi:hypothetical protein